VLQNIRKESATVSTTYMESPEIKEVADKLSLGMGWLSTPKIKYLMMFADRSSYLGKCSKAAGKWRHLTGIDYVVEVWATFWDSAEDDAKEALIYHELKHITSKVDSQGGLKWGIRKHDIEEFLDVAEKYGAWDKSIKCFVEKLVEYENRNKQ
jgi:hypothetical protein